MLTLRRLFLVYGLNVATSVFAQSANEQALGDLRKFLFDPQARASFVHGKADASAANHFLESFPPWAQQDLLEIVMMVVTEEGANADRRSQTLARSGGLAAKNSFSPPVQAKIEALFRKLEKDPAFNNPRNLEQMKRKMPSQR